MLPRKAGPVSLVVLALVTLFPALSAAQTGSIGGVAKDTSGAVLPGVTVEVTSPALIEKIRTATTDGQGVYRIVDLRPGVYAITFSLPDFATVKREGIDLAVGVTVTINAEMRPSGVQETLTVSGASPVVDIQNASEVKTLATDVTQELPAARSFQILAVLIPGVTVSGVTGTLNLQDVGGSMGERNTTVSIYGSTDMVLMFDGMRHNSTLGAGGGGTGGYVVNPGMVEEIAIDTSGAPAEVESSGVRANVIPKQGGNAFSGVMVGNFANSSMQSNNLTDALRAQGVTSPYVTNKLEDINPTFGGPIKKDKVWFFFSYRYSDTTDQPPGAFQDANPASIVFTPNLSQPVLAPNWTSSAALRVTAALSPTSKIAVYADVMRRCWCAVGLSSTLAYEATSRFVTPTMDMYQATWDWVASNRLLIDVGETIRPEAWAYDQQPGVPLDRTGIFDLGTGMIYRANPGFPPASSLRFVGNAVQENGKASITFVTGSHNLKVGSQWISGFFDEGEYANTDKYYSFLNGAPVAVTYRTTPNYTRANIKLGLGAYIQDQWTRKRLTLNLGARFDYFNAYIPPQYDAGGTYVGARSFPQYSDLPDYKDLTPRFGAAYDLFGDGKTAVKAFVGRFVTLLGSTQTEALVNPMTVQGSTTRALIGSIPIINNEPVITGDPLNPAANGNLGPTSNANFGSPLLTTNYAPNTVTGWGTRSANWEADFGIQHELRPGLSVEASYHRRWFENFTVTQNLLTSPTNYSPFCVTAPVDPRLGAVSGQSVCGLYDVAPTLFGQSNNLVSLSDKFGNEFKHYNGVDLIASARFPGGLTLQGGTNTGRLETNTCFVVNSPQELLYCDVRPPFQTQAKVLAIYPLPWWGLQTSATYQTLPGPQITASWAAPASAVTGLGRSLAGGAKTVTVPLIAPGTVYGDRMNQLDVRLAKNVKIAGYRVQPQFDLYNVFNASAILAVNTTYGSAWQTPTAILAGRILKIGVLITF